MHACQVTVEWSMLSSWATSRVVVKESASVTDLNWSSTSDGWPLRSSSLRFSFPLQKFLNHHHTVCSRAVSGPNVLLVLQVVSTGL